MKQNIKIFLSIVFILLSYIPHKMYAAMFTSSDVEVVTALARGPLASLSERYHGDHSAKGKFIHAMTDFVRLMNNIFTIANHQPDESLNPLFWTMFDSASLFSDLRKSNIIQAAPLQENSEEIDENKITEQQSQMLDDIIKKTQLYVLPFIESCTALLIATSTQQTPEDLVNRRQLRALCSLSRSLAVYSNNKKSVFAILLLLCAITEMASTLKTPQSSIFGRRYPSARPESIQPARPARPVNYQQNIPEVITEDMERDLLEGMRDEMRLHPNLYNNQALELIQHRLNELERR